MTSGQGKSRGAVASDRAGKGRRCPTCGRPAASEFRPFCSRRCADIDLGRWLKGIYRIPTEERPGSDAPDETPEEAPKEPSDST